MATLELAIAASHAPGLTGWLDSVAEDSQERVRKGYQELESAIDAAKLDVLVVLANDHMANARVTAYPDFTIALGDRHEGPDEWFEEWLKVPPYSLPGDPELADQIFVGLVSRGFPMYATTHNLRYDDNVSVPTALTHLEEKGIRVVPILQNCTVPPIPDGPHCYAFGQALRDVIDALPDHLRVGVFATGGMAHEPGGPRYFFLDPEFDRSFLALLEEGDHDRLLREATLEAMEEAGSGGTAELLTWMIVAAAAGEDATCHTIFYDPIKQMRCGIGAAQWQLSRTEVPA